MITHSNMQNVDEAINDSIRRSKTELLADETSRLLFGRSTSLLDDLFRHPLSIDYFNVYLSLPIFGQRLFYHRTTHQFDFDPSLSCKHQTNNQFCEETRQWLVDCRLNDYIHTDIYIESLLGLLLIKSDESIHAFIDSKEVTIEEQSYIFTTVTDLRQFHQFLQSTSGIKYWNFFIDSMRVLQSRYSSRFNRIDISHLSFIHKYYCQQKEFRSIMIDCKKSSMPDSSTSDAVWFQMAINAMYQLRTYWLPRYISEFPSIVRSKIKQSRVQQMKNHNQSLSTNNNDDNTNTISSNHRSHTNSISDNSNLVKFTLDNMSYLDYNSRQYVLIESSKEHDFEEDHEALGESNDHPTKVDYINQSQQPSTEQSIEDYATDDHLEFFYRILISDSLAGGPFSNHISLTTSKDEATLLQTCLHFITDLEVVLSLPSGNFKTRILKQFISRYLSFSTIDRLSIQLFDNTDEQRTELINELLTENINEESLLWKILLKITKILIPHYFNYIKFDRLRFLLQNNSMNTDDFIDDLHHCIPSINFEGLRVDQQTILKQGDSNKSKLFSQINLKNCGVQLNDFQEPLNEKQYYTTEKSINTDEKCEFQPNERFPPLTDDELKQELRQFCTTYQLKDTKTKITSSQPDITISINEPEKLTPDKIEIDRFVSTLMNESLDLYRMNSSSKAEETFSMINNINMSEFDFKNNLFNKQDTKFLSPNGFYFISSPNQTLRSNYLPNIDSTPSIPNMTQSLLKKIKRTYDLDDVFHESLYFAPKDKCNEIKTSITENQIPSFSIDHQKQLLIFIQNELTHQKWPIDEYFGIKQQRSWRAFKLAVEISNFDDRLTQTSHHDSDWVTTDYDLGSFGERIRLIQPNSSKYITNIHDSCSNQYY